jgi:hypothetical protein
MSRLGSTRGPVATLNDHALRLVGLAFVVWGGAVTAASVTTEYGLAVPEDVTANALGSDLATVGSVVAFALAHPAYPALLLAGLVLAVLGDDVPLLGS